jgi:hypothetical protein
MIPRLALAAALAAATPAHAARAVYDFNPGWRLAVGDPPGAAGPAFDDGGWRAVSLPHA